MKRNNSCTGERSIKCVVLGILMDTLGEGKWDDAKRVLSFNTCMDIFTHTFRLQSYKSSLHRLAVEGLSISDDSGTHSFFQSSVATFAMSFILRMETTCSNYKYYDKE